MLLVFIVLYTMLIVYGIHFVVTPNPAFTEVNLLKAQHLEKI